MTNSPKFIPSASARAPRSLGRRELLLAAGASVLTGLPLASVQALSSSQQAVLRQVERILNGISTAQGRFMQVSATGNIVRGNIFLSRPGKIRFEYDPPSPLMVIADGYWLAQVDRELDSTTTQQLSGTPLNFLLASNVSFTNGVSVTSMETVGDSLLVSVVQSSNPGQGSLMLILDRNNLSLQAWQVIDKRGERTTVRLESMNYGAALDSRLFQIPRNG